MISPVLEFIVDPSPKSGLNVKVPPEVPVILAVAPVQLVVKLNVASAELLIINVKVPVV